MEYPIKYRQQKLNKVSPASRKVSALKVIPQKTNEAFYVPTWGWFNNYDDLSHMYDMIWDARNEGAPIYDTLWIGKNIAPTIYYASGDWLNWPTSTKTTFKSLAFEDGRTDNFLETFFDPNQFEHEGPHSIVITQSIKFPEEITTSMIQNVEFGFVNSEGRYDEIPNSYSWNVYLPKTLTTIDFNDLENLQGHYFEAPGREGPGELFDQQVHIYLEKHTTVPTIIRQSFPTDVEEGSTEEPEVFYNENANIYFHVNADIYDDFVTAYDGQFKGIIKIEPAEVGSWIDTRPEIVKTGSYDSLIDKPFYSEDISDKTYDLNIIYGYRSRIYDEDDRITDGELFSIENGGGYSVIFEGVTYTDDMEGLRGQTVNIPRDSRPEETIEISYIGNLKALIEYNPVFYTIPYIDNSYAQSLTDNGLPFCIITNEWGDTSVWTKCSAAEDQTITVSRTVLDQSSPTYTIMLEELEKTSLCLVSTDTEEAIHEFDVKDGNTIILNIDGKKISTVWEYSEEDTKDSTVQTFRAVFEKEGLVFIITRQDGGGAYYDEKVYFMTDPSNIRTVQVKTLKTEYHTIDEKFIPNSIARITDIPDIGDLFDGEGGSSSLEEVVSLEISMPDSENYSITPEGIINYFDFPVEVYYNPLVNSYSYSWYFDCDDSAPEEFLNKIHNQDLTFTWDGKILVSGHLDAPYDDSWGESTDHQITLDTPELGLIINSGYGLSFSFFANSDELFYGTHTLGIYLGIGAPDSRTIKKKYLPYIEEVEDRVEEAENKLATLFDTSKYISGLDVIDFVFLEPSDSSTKIITQYNNTASEEVTPR